MSEQEHGFEIETYGFNFIKCCETHSYLHSMSCFNCLLLNRIETAVQTEVCVCKSVFERVCEHPLYELQP